MPTKLKNGETMLFIGDSITDCGRREAQHQPLGYGYVHMVSDMLTIREPQKKITVVNRGIAGNTVSDLRDRWHDDVLELNPDWLSVKIGINDLNQSLNNHADLPPEKFEAIYDELLAQTVEEMPKCRLLLIDPFFMSREQTEDPYYARVLHVIPGYIAAAHRLSRKYKTRLIKAHDLFQEQLKHHDMEIFSDEPVHPNSAGHLLIADAVYKVLCR